MSINVYMVRHGQTYLNKYRRMQGWTNAPLTEKGIADGQAAGERLRHVHFDGGADVKIMDRFFRYREVPDSENFSKPGFQLKTA